MSVECEPRLTIGWRVKTDAVPDYMEREWDSGWEELEPLVDRASETFAKVFGVCENNRIAIYVPGEIPEHRFQSINAHRVRETFGDE